jgi:hypothetical protein
MISFTLTSPEGYAGYNNYTIPILQFGVFNYMQTKLVPRQGLC